MRCHSNVFSTFNGAHFDKNLNDQYIREIIAKFVVTGSFLKSVHHPEQRVKNEVAEIAVVEQVEIEIIQSVRQRTSLDRFTQSIHKN